LPTNPFHFEINHPTLLLDKQKCIRNIDRLIEKAKRSDVNLRPHFKTHQSHEIGRWFKERGISCCTVSSLKMAQYFSEDGWKDITVAFPLNYLEIDLINSLASKIQLNLLVSISDVLPRLLKQLENKVGIFIEIDTGYHRTGIDPSHSNELESIISDIASSSLLEFKGLLSHAGHTYKCRSKAAVEKIYFEEVGVLLDLKSKYNGMYPDLVLSVGDTPSASLVDDFSEVDELRAGNLVFYDLTQATIGSCDLDQIAIVIACPVVATYPDRGEVIIYGGGVHFSKDYMTTESGTISYGAVVLLNDIGWALPPTEMFVKALSQEHGTVHANAESMRNIKPGDVLGVLPVHSCLMADAMGSYMTLNGEPISRLS
jgi:D-serine deaminase-like pyridoxal phosphate-dependent protein